MNSGRKVETSKYSGVDRSGKKKRCSSRTTAARDTRQRAEKTSEVTAMAVKQKSRGGERRSYLDSEVEDWRGARWRTCIGMWLSNATPWARVRDRALRSQPITHVECTYNGTD